MLGADLPPKSAGWVLKELKKAGNPPSGPPTTPPADPGPAEKTKICGNAVKGCTAWKDKGSSGVCYKFRHILWGDSDDSTTGPVGVFCQEYKDPKAADTGEEANTGEEAATGEKTGEKAGEKTGEEAGEEETGEEKTGKEETGEEETGEEETGTGEDGDGMGYEDPAAISFSSNN